MPHDHSDMYQRWLDEHLAVVQMTPGDYAIPNRLAAITVHSSASIRIASAIVCDAADSVARCEMMVQFHDRHPTIAAGIDGVPAPPEARSRILGAHYQLEDARIALRQAEILQDTLLRQHYHHARQDAKVRMRAKIKSIEALESTAEELKQLCQRATYHANQVTVLVTEALKKF